jgi:hypothetical protein
VEINGVARVASAGDAGIFAPAEKIRGAAPLNLRIFRRSIAAWISLSVRISGGLIMRVTTAGLRPAFGLFVIAHGLAHAVLPMRGWIDPASTTSAIPLIFYCVTVVGFTIAGLGIFGVRPFAPLLRPALVLASAYSLIALVLMTPGNLRLPAFFDLILFIVGVAGPERFLPAVPHHGRLRRVVGVAGIAVIIYASGAVLLWPFHRAWGSFSGEHAMAFPGDSTDRNRALELQHAVTVDAPPQEVWQWLVQLGQDRAGFYSYDWLERAFGVQVRNVTEIRPEWQTRRAGDRVHATQRNYLGGVFGEEPGWTVNEVIPGRAMVLQYWGAFVLEPTADGKTRFIIRTNVGDRHIPAWAAVIDMVAFEMPHFIMERRMMLRIKALAEAGAIKT